MDSQLVYIVVSVSVLFQYLHGTKKAKANSIESLVNKIIRNEYGRKWARSINEWRHSCYSINDTDKCDTIYIYIELIPWEAHYSEVIQIGCRLYGFTNKIDCGELSCEIDEELSKLCDIMNDPDINRKQKYIWSKEEGEKVLDLSPINVITIRKHMDAYVYDSELVYFVGVD